MIDKCTNLCYKSDFFFHYYKCPLNLTQGFSVDIFKRINPLCVHRKSIRKGKQLCNVQRHHTSIGAKFWRNIIHRCRIIYSLHWKERGKCTRGYHGKLKCLKSSFILLSINTKLKRCLVALPYCNRYVQFYSACQYQASLKNL